MAAYISQFKCLTVAPVLKTHYIIQRMYTASGFVHFFSISSIQNLWIQLWLKHETAAIISVQSQSGGRSKIPTMKIRLGRSTVGQGLVKVTVKLYWMKI